MSNKAKLLISTIVTLVPGLAMAELPQALRGSATDATVIITQTLPRLFFGLAVVYFFWGLGSYAFGVDDKTKAAAKTTMIYGVIIIFVMTSLWGIVSALQSATGTGGAGTGVAPAIQ